MVVAGSGEGDALAGGAVQGGAQHRAPCLGVPPDRGHVDAAPQRGLLERDAAPRRARELGAAHDLAGAQLEEDDAQDVARQPRPVPRRRRRFHAAAEAAAAGGGGHRLGWERVDLRQ